MIKRQLDKILNLVDLECAGKKVEVDGFRLKNLSNWQTGITRSSIDGLIPLSGVCNCDCVFCYERNHPIRSDSSVLSIEEARTRLKYFNEETSGSLFPSTRRFREAFCNPNALKILRMARPASPESLIIFTTNGSYLTRNIVEELAKLKPLMLKISVNSSNPEIREMLMRGKNMADVALKSLALMREYGIPFIGSLVAWPSTLEEDMIETIRFLDEHDPYRIRVRLPIYHKFMFKTDPFDTSELWNKVVNICDRIRGEIDAPLHPEPTLYWVNPIIPQIDGVIKNSPAWQVGLKQGDIIKTIDSHRMATRSHAKGFLRRATAYLRHPSHGRKITIEVERNGKTLTFELREDFGKDDDLYPYKPVGFSSGKNFGIFLVDDFQLSDVEYIMNTIDWYGARRILVFSSPIVKPIFEQVIQNVPVYRDYFATKEIFTEFVKTSYWGGNTFMLDGRIIEDFIPEIEKFIEERGKPDLILIPAAFGSLWGFDLLFRSFKELEEIFDLPVEIIPWTIIYGRYDNEM